MAIKNSKNFVFLLAVVLVGESVISYPFSGNIGNDLLGGALGIIVAAITALFLKSKAAKLTAAEPGLKAFLLLALAVMSLLSFSVCLLDFSKYAGKVMLNTSSIIIPAISLIALIAFTVKKGIGVILKLGSVLFLLSFIFIVLTFAFSLPYIEVKYLGFYKAPTVGGFLSSFSSVGVSTFIASLPMIFLSKEQKTKCVLWGFVLGGGMIFLCLINTLGIFGAEFAKTLAFPYSYAVSTASVGRIFSRMDPFLYCTCFFTCLIKCSVCLYVTASAVKKLPYKILFPKK